MSTAILCCKIKKIEARVTELEENGVGGVGPAGPAGPEGPAGPAGADGADGADGDSYPVDNIVPLTGTTHTITSAEMADRPYYRSDNAGGCAITIPLNSVDAIPIGSDCSGIREGGALSFDNDALVIVNNEADLATVPAGGAWYLKKVGTNEWDFVGGASAGGSGISEAYADTLYKPLNWLPPLVIALGNEDEDVIVVNNKLRFRAEFAFNLLGIRLSSNDAPTGAPITVDMTKNGVSVLTDKAIIESTEDTSVTGPPVVIATPAFADNDWVGFDILTAGSTTPGTGLKATIYRELPAT